MQARSRLPALFLFVTVLSAALPLRADAPAWPHEGSDIPASPRVTWGRLPNGLRYALLPNAVPARHASVRLWIDAGSLHENDDEQGYAHFVEHMAFNGTRHFPAGELVKFLQRQGTAFGAHANAFTGQTSTFYKIELPELNPEKLNTALRALRDYADGLLFDPAEVERERGVILSEALSRNTPNYAVARATLNYLYEGTLIARRMPIGTEASIKAATPERLRAFYDAWYRPARMVVVICGVIDVRETEEALLRAFGSLNGRGEPRSDPAIGRLAITPSLSAHVHRKPAGTLSVSLFASMADTRGNDREARRHRNAQLSAAHGMIQRRLDRIKATPEAPLSGSHSDDEWHGGAFRTVQLTAFGNPDQWKRLVALLEQELRRACEHGFDPSELAAYQAAQRERIRSNASAASALGSSTLADWLCEAIEQKSVFVLPDERMTRALQTIDQLTPENCQAELRHRWIGTPLRVFVATSAARPPSGKDVLAEFEKSRALKVEPPGAAQAVTLAYQDFGPPGTLRKIEELPEAAATLVEYANGVRANLKATTFLPGIVQMRVRVGYGALSEPRGKPGLRHWFATVPDGGLGKHTMDEMATALLGKTVTFRFTASDDAFVIHAQGVRDDGPLLCRLVAAFLSDPGFHPSGARAAIARFNTLLQPMEQRPDATVYRRVVKYLAGGDSRLALPEKEDLYAYEYRDVTEFLRPVLQEDPVEIAVVGDFDGQAMLAELARTVGALPRREPRRALLAERTLKFPTPPKTQRYTYPRDDGPTRVQLVWPVRASLTFVDRRKLGLLALVLHDRARVKLREELAESYSPEARFQSSEAFPGFAFLSLAIDVRPDRATSVLKVARELANELARQGATPDEFERARLQRVTALQQERSQNGYWLDLLEDIQEKPARRDELQRVEEGLATATKADLDALAAKYLRDRNLFTFTIEPKATKKR